MLGDLGENLVSQLLDALSAEPVPGKPTGILAHTHKGHPISYMSDNVAWHQKVPNAEQYATAVTELGGDR